MEIASRLASLEARNLTVSFAGKTPAIRDVSLKIDAGERIAIVGPNGSGKSTLLRALSGRFSTLNAQVFLDGTPLSLLSRQHIAQSIAVVAQHDHADFRLSVSDYVSLGQIPYFYNPDSQRQIERAICQAGVAAYRHQTLGTLSGGQMQRVLLARAFAQTSRILLLDEPTNHLDLRARSDILALVRHSSASIVVTVLHDLSLLPYVADKVCVMHNGKLVAMGSVNDIFSESLLKDVFGMTRFAVEHPGTGKQIWVFEPSIE